MLKECPFCGSEAMMKKHKYGMVNVFFAICTNSEKCGVRTLAYLTPYQAEKTWNRRKHESKT